MTLNPPRKVRAILYLLTAIGTPVAAYLKVKGYIGDEEVAQRAVWLGREPSVRP